MNPALFRTWGGVNIVFFGTPEFGAVILRKLIAANLKPCLAVTQPDRPAGRNQKITPSAVKVVAEEHGIPLLQTERLEETAVNRLQETNPDLFVLASFGTILPKKVLGIPKKGALNVHPSLLPKFRGPSPVQETILQGQEQTGVTIMLMDEKIDHGPILAQEKLTEPIGSMNTEELKARLAELGGGLLAKTIPLWTEGKLQATPQKEEEATFTSIIEKKDGKIDWNKEAEYIARQVRAFYPWPGTFTSWKGKILKILKASSAELSEQSPPGTVIPLQEKFAVAAKKGALLLEELQLEGGKPVSSRDFLLGHRDFLGTVLE